VTRAALEWLEIFPLFNKVFSLFLSSGFGAKIPFSWLNNVTSWCLAQRPPTPTAQNIKLAQPPFLDYVIVMDNPLLNDIKRKICS